MQALMERTVRRAALAVALTLSALAAGPTAAVEVLTGETTEVLLQVSKGQLIRLDAPSESVYLADPAIADLEVMAPDLIYLFGRQPGETNLYAVGADNRVVADIQLIVGTSVTGMNETLSSEIPNGNIEASAVGNVVMLHGQSDSAMDIANAAQIAGAFLPPNSRLINRTEVTGPQQVNLRVRFVEVSRSSVRRLGIDWEAFVNTGNFFLTGATGAFLNNSTFGAPVNVVGDALLGGYLGNSFGVNAVIDALEQENLVRILAEPNLTTISGETASFLAGGEFPIPTAVNDNEVEITFKSFVVSLAFTPTVLDGGRISMRVMPEVSELSPAASIQLGSISIPGLSVRRAETTVELGSGQTFAIAGLFQTSFKAASDVAPFLADLPILGPLFQRNDFEQDESELVIFVTPYLVEPVSADQIMSPTDRLVAPRDQIPAARLAGVGSNSVLAGSPVGGVIGSAGFILK